MDRVLKEKIQNYSFSLFNLLPSHNLDVFQQGQQPLVNVIRANALFYPLLSISSRMKVLSESIILLSDRSFISSGILLRSMAELCFDALFIALFSSGQNNHGQRYLSFSQIKQIHALLELIKRSNSKEHTKQACLKLLESLTGGNSDSHFRLFIQDQAKLARLQTLVDTLVEKFNNNPAVLCDEDMGLKQVITEFSKITRKFESWRPSRGILNYSDNQSKPAAIYHFYERVREDFTSRSNDLGLDYTDILDFLFEVYTEIGHGLVHSNANFNKFIFDGQNFNSDLDKGSQAPLVWLLMPTALLAYALKTANIISLGDYQSLVSLHKEIDSEFPD